MIAATMVEINVEQ